jgi:predicted aspartyl protease
LIRKFLLSGAVAFALGCAAAWPSSGYAQYIDAMHDAEGRCQHGDAAACGEAKNLFATYCAHLADPSAYSGSKYDPSVPRAKPQAGIPAPATSGRSEIALHGEGGAFTVPVSINGAITLQFTIDSGAADVSIPADVVMTLMRTGTIDRSDFLGNRTYVMADGSTAPSPTFRIRSLRVGNREVRNVTGSIAPVKGGLLLGQSFLRQFGSWSIDNRRGVLVLGD